MSITFEPVKEHIGAIAHIDRARLFDHDVAAATMAAVEERGVVVFPRVNLTDAEQVAFTDRLGDRVTFTNTAPGGEGSEVYHITLDDKLNENPEYVHGTFFWHMDGLLIDQPPPAATILSCRKSSATGGQTEICNLYAAYEHLPDWEKEAIEGLRVVHTMQASIRDVVDVVNEETVPLLKLAKPQEYPIVWHRASGRKSLLIGSHADYIVDKPMWDGRAIIARLIEWAGQPEFRYTHHWQEGDLAVWDNRGAMHRVFPYPADSGRMMHRTSIAGTERVQ